MMRDIRGVAEWLRLVRYRCGQWRAYHLLPKGLRNSPTARAWWGQRLGHGIVYDERTSRVYGVRLDDRAFCLAYSPEMRFLPVQSGPNFVWAVPVMAIVPTIGYFILAGVALAVGPPWSQLILVLNYLSTSMLAFVGFCLGGVLAFRLIPKPFWVLRVSVGGTVSVVPPTAERPKAVPSPNKVKSLMDQEPLRRFLERGLPAKMSMPLAIGSMTVLILVLLVAAYLFYSIGQDAPAAPANTAEATNGQ